jgi:hypothetical protein
VISAFDRVGRKSETFWKVFSNLYNEHGEEAFSLEEHLMAMSCLANFYPLTTYHLYQRFERRHLPAPTAPVPKDFLFQRGYSKTTENELALLNILDKYRPPNAQGGTSSSIRDLYYILSSIQLRKIKEL